MGAQTGPLEVRWSARLVSVLRRLPEFLHQSINVVADVIGPRLGILDHRVAVPTPFGLGPGLDEPTQQPLCLSGEAFNLVGDAAAGIGASLRSEQHAQGKSQGAPCQCAVHPNSSRALS